MRRFLLAAVMIGTVSSAQAADMPDFLRGSLSSQPSPTVNWAGVYIGGQAAYGVSDMDFTNSGQDLLAKLLNNVIISSGVTRWSASN
jgi:outer membrane immunogenic protein